MPSAGAHSADAAIGVGLRRGGTHDYVRHGTTTLFAALNVLNGAILAECKPRQLVQEKLIKAPMEFLGAIAQAGTEGQTVRLSPAMVQPIASDDVAAATADAALGTPVNGAWSRSRGRSGLGCLALFNAT